jgi:S-methylmethionine-dependent homocysteine/selenocysteine methylase
MKSVRLPNEGDQMFLTDAGFETWMLFKEGFEMPHFAAFPLLRSTKARAAIREYFEPLFDLARQHNAGFVLDTNTWRASPDWGPLLGFDPDELAKLNAEAVESVKVLRDTLGHGVNTLINGVIGPRGDGYDPKTIMTAQEAQDYHSFQIGVFARSKVDMISALTITNIPEAIGVANAAAEFGIPCVISFTLETDGCLPTGEKLSEAIAQVDANTTTKPAYFMINCAHPDHFRHIAAEGGDWINRLGGLRANASRMSHAELDNSEELDDGNPVELGQQYADLKAIFPAMNVFGGCCGTDHRHVAQICGSLNSGT